MEITEIQLQMLNRTINTLKALKLPFAIIDFGGVKHGDLDVVVKKPRKTFGTPHGELTSYVRPFIDKMKVGDVICIPATEKFELQRVMTASGNYSARVFGKKNCTLHKNTKRGVIEIFRISEEKGEK